MKGPRRQRLFRYCTHCNKTTEQVRLQGDQIWRCDNCGCELKEVQGQQQASPPWWEKQDFGT